MPSERLDAFRRRTETRPATRVPLARGEFEYIVEPHKRALGKTRVSRMAFITPDGERVPLAPLLEDDPEVIFSGSKTYVGALHLATPERARWIEAEGIEAPYGLGVFLHEFFHAHQCQDPILEKIMSVRTGLAHAWKAGASPSALLRFAAEIAERIPYMRTRYARLLEHASDLYDGHLDRDDAALEAADRLRIRLEEEEERIERDIFEEEFDAWQNLRYCIPRLLLREFNGCELSADDTGSDAEAAISLFPEPATLHIRQDGTARLGPLADGRAPSRFFGRIPSKLHANASGIISGGCAPCARK